MSLSSPEASPIRRIMFHPSGDALFTGSQDSLRVHEWEPSNQLDYLPVAWGKVADMQLSGDQLVSNVECGGRDDVDLNIHLFVIIEEQRFTNCYFEFEI